MREINVSDIIKGVASICIDANYRLGSDVQRAILKAKKYETSDLGCEILDKLIENLAAAEKMDIPICQDTGMAVIFVELGQDVHIVGGSLEKAICDGVGKGYAEGYLRASMVSDPLNRKNTGNNTPPIIHTRIAEGDKLKITIAPKGAGSENMSRIKMMAPTSSKEQVIDFIVSCVSEAGANPCPPIVVGVGIGGSFEKAALLAKQALLRPVDTSSKEPFYREMEEEILKRVNALGIGPQGFGGRTTALAVHIEHYATHIACLPVAVNINCHVARHKEVIL
jgi:fumarate hydratase subunit alpha